MCARQTQKFKMCQLRDVRARRSKCMLWGKYTKFESRIRKESRDIGNKSGTRRLRQLFMHRARKLDEWDHWLKCTKTGRCWSVRVRRFRNSLLSSMHVRTLHNDMKNSSSDPGTRPTVVRAMQLLRSREVSCVNRCMSGNVRIASPAKFRVVSVDTTCKLSGRVAKQRARFDCKFLQIWWYVCHIMKSPTLVDVQRCKSLQSTHIERDLWNTQTLINVQVL